MSEILQVDITHCTRTLHATVKFFENEILVSEVELRVTSYKNNDMGWSEPRCQIPYNLMLTANQLDTILIATSGLFAEYKKRYRNG